MRCRSTVLVDEAELARLREPRTDIVGERRGDQPDTFELAEGPFRHYRRTLTVEERADGGDARAGDPIRVTQSFDFALAIPVWWLLFAWPVRRTLLEPDPEKRRTWWAPPSRLDARASSVLGLLACLSVISGYLGTVITQTITFAADEFDVSKSAQSDTLSAVRIGIVVSLAMTALADRRGRRRMAVYGAGAACIFTALGALAPDLWTLGAAQTIARGITTAVGVLIVVIAAEELPAGARAYGISVLALAAALGSGMAVWALPLADLGERGWRLIYVIPLVAVPFLPYIAHHLPETRRFEATRDAPGDPAAPRSSIAANRLVLLCAASFLLLVFRTPASQLQNEFLRDERGFSGTKIALFTIITSTPAGIGVFLGGRLADSRGRRVVGAIGVLGGAGFTVLAFLTDGAVLWAATLLGMTVGSLTVASLGVYGPELFTTRARGRANGYVTLAGVLGSVTGLTVAGRIADRSSLGAALAVLSVGPLLLAILVLRRFPETAQLELEELNPADAPLPHDRTAVEHPQ
jgi:MFS family permease